jgi:hypothetical protein
MCGLKGLNKNSTAYSRTAAPEKDGGFCFGPDSGCEPERNQPMTSQELNAIQTLREKGYAVAVWEPAEVGLADPRAIEEQAIDTFPCGRPHKPTLTEIEGAGEAILYFLTYAITFQIYIQNF